MSNSSLKKRKLAAWFLAPLLACLACFLIACSPDIKADRAIEIAKQDFGCEKILWIKSGALMLSKELGGEQTRNPLRSHYEYFIVGEKDGQEVYIVVPSDPNLEQPFTVTWALDYTFKQIVEKFNKHGAQYVADVPDDYYSVDHDSYINLRVGDTLDGLAEYYTVDDRNTFYERLDVKAVFEYTWAADGKQHSCIVTQEHGELKTYEQIS